VIDEVRGFDEAYFMYLEDVDLCWRIGRAGWRVRYEPSARVTHVQGLSTAQTPYRMLAAHHVSLLRFWWRTTPGAGRLLAPAVVAGLGLRLGLMAAKRARVGRAHR
jgi:N-acetylglucosaminyl-diphospho-decaprenol L-rhamnosyltransferase